MIKRSFAKRCQHGLCASKGVQAMVRVAVLVVAILVGYDHFMYNGMVRSAALQATNQILHHFGVI
jgi:hypothetical protein